MLNIASSFNKSPATYRKKYAAPKHPSFAELKKKYESNAVANQEIPKHRTQLTTPKLLKMCKVKQIASMFNLKISQNMPPDATPQPTTSLTKPLMVPTKRYKKERAPSPKTKPLVKAEQKPISLVSEDNFSKLSVKEKIKLYSQFIYDMSKKNPVFGKHAKQLEANVKKVVAAGEVVNEKQESVKHLLEELEARCVFPKQTISPLALQRIDSVRNAIRKIKHLPKGPIKSKEYEDISEKKMSHKITLTVNLQSDVNNQQRSRSLPRRWKDQEKVSTSETSHKRNNDAMRCSLPIEAYAPPKKIRHVSAERLPSQVVFPNEQFESLFFTWLKEKQNQGELQNIKEDIESKSAIDSLLEEAVAKMETATSKIKEDTTGKKTEILTSRKKKPAPPVPLEANKIIETFIDSSARQTEAEESESGLSSLPKITSEDSQADTYEKESENSANDADIGQPVKPLRKKKIRRNLVSKKDTDIEEFNPKTSTDSDSDFKIVETKIKNKMLYAQPQTEETSAALSSTLPQPRELNLTHITKAESNHYDIDINENIKSRAACSCSSQVDSQFELDISAKNKALSTNLTASTLSYKDSKAFTDSCIDQGFETGSNDTESPIRAPKRSTLKRQDPARVASSLFDKSGCDIRRYSSETACNLAENPLGYSTPIKGYFQQPIQQQQLFSPIEMPLKTRRRSIYDTESSRNSLAMQVIREDHPLEQYQMNSPRHTPTTDINCQNPKKSSQFWIKCGDFSVSLDIYYNQEERIRLLYEIFSQRSWETKDLHFGIDNHTFSVYNPNDKENMPTCLPANKDCSHYWFSTGKLAIPFKGKYISADKVQRLFQFIKASVEETGILHFGVDAVEFSNVPEFWNQSPKFSMESNYSMLVGLQTGNSNGLEGRSKFAWPNKKPVQISDLDQSSCEYETFEDNDFSPSSVSPFSNNHTNLAALGAKELSMPRNSEAMLNGESFDFDYENESLDHLFEDKYYTEQMPNMEREPIITAVATTPNTVNNLKTKLESVRLEQDSALSRDNFDALKGTPEYLGTLKGIVAEIINKGSNDGFKDCTVQQLESYIFYLSRYTDICVHNCSNQTDTMLNALAYQIYNDLCLYKNVSNSN